MEVSKVTFFRETKTQLTSPVLDDAKKKKLRLERMKEYIRSKPVGTLIGIAELVEAGGWDKSIYNEYQTGWRFVRKLIRDKKLIYTVGEKKMKGSWAIPGDERIVRQRTQSAPAETLPAVNTDQLAQAKDIENKAREFAWSENSNDLRDFITWMKILA